jgi:hypothetical protein
MIYRHEMLGVAERAMRNPRAAWFTVRPLAEKPMPYPFRLPSDEGQEHVVPGVVAQFAVEHPEDMSARRVISIAATDHGYAVWCGDKFTQGDITALDASLRVALAVAELPEAYVEGTRAAMLSLYGSYPLRAPCHFWHAWHKDQGVCKHVAAALQYVAGAYDGGMGGLLEQLDGMLDSLTTEPLTHLLAPRAPSAPSHTATQGRVASTKTLAQLIFPQGGPAAGAQLGAPAFAPRQPKDATPANFAFLGEFLLGNTSVKAFNLRDALLHLGRGHQHPHQCLNKQGDTQKEADAAASAHLHKLVKGLEPALERALLQLAGSEDASCKHVVWGIPRLVSTNRQLRAAPKFGSLANLLFIADTPNEDGLFALSLDADGSLRRPEVYRLNTAKMQVEWYAEDLDIYRRRRASEVAQG